MSDAEESSGADSPIVDRDFDPNDDEEFEEGSEVASEDDEEEEERPKKGNKRKGGDARRPEKQKKKKKQKTSRFVDIGAEEGSEGEDDVGEIEETDEGPILPPSLSFGLFVFLVFFLFAELSPAAVMRREMQKQDERRRALRERNQKIFSDNPYDDRGDDLAAFERKYMDAPADGDEELQEDEFEDEAVRRPPSILSCCPIILTACV